MACGRRHTQIPAAAALALMPIDELAGADPIDVMAFTYPDEDEANAGVKANRDIGHGVYGPYRTDMGWLEIIDLRPALAAAIAERHARPWRARSHP